MTNVLVASSSWLITPNIGLMVWTLVVFAISLFILVKAVFPRIGAALDQRRKAIDDSIDAAEHTRLEADQLLDGGGIVGREGESLVEQREGLVSPVLPDQDRAHQAQDPSAEANAEASGRPQD